MKFLIFDREESYIGNLKDVLEAKHTEEINGEDVLSIATLDKSIGKGYKLVYKDKYGFWKEYIVKEIEESHTNGGIEKRLFCESSFYETFGDYIEDKRPSGTANSALAVALEPTRWKVGTVDNLGVNATNFYQISAKEAVQKVAETWKGEIRTRVEVVGNKIVHRYVDILERRGGDYGRRFTYTKNLESVTKIIHREDVITALYGYGKGEEVGDGHGRRIDFASINDGKAYVENLEAKEIWGRPNGDGTKSHVYGKVEFDNCEDKQELLQLTTEKLEEVSSPLVTYEAKAIDLGGADLGDDVAVIDTEFTPTLRLKARVIKIVRDLLKEENNNLVLGSFIPSIVDSWNKQEEYINNFRGKQGVWDRADIINNDGTINAQFLNNLVDELNQKMNSQGGYVYVSEDGKGLTTYDKPIDQDPTMAIQLLGGAFRIANSKLPNGEFDWRSFGTGAGFTADEIIAGILKGGKVHFDLTNGTFLIGKSTEDYNFYFDGTSLKIKLSSGKTVEESLQAVEVKTTPEAITTTVRSSPLYAGDLDKKANSDEIVSIINQTAETIKIQANKIDLVGAVTVLSDIAGNLGTITAGALEGEKVKFDLTNGTMLIGNSTEDYVLLFDGHSLKLNFGGKLLDERLDEIEDNIENIELTPGPQGVPGKDGKDGSPTYTWIRYADTPTSGMSNFPDGKKYIGMAFNKTTETESNNYSDYQWSLMPQNIEIGGRNLFTSNGWEFYTPYATLEEYDGTRRLVFRENASSLSSTVAIKNSGFTSKAGIYTFSGYVTVDGEMPSKSYFQDISNRPPRGTPTIEYDDNTGYFAITQQIPEISDYSWTIHATANGKGGTERLIELTNIKFEKGDKATDWTPAPEDVDEAIQNAQDTADQANSKADGLQDDLIEYKETTATAEELGELIATMNDYMATLDIANTEVENAKIEIANLLERVPAVELQLGEFIQDWIFLDTYVRMGEEGLLIQEINGQTGIRITTDRIDFLDGSGEPVAYITNQIMRINRGIFVDSAQIGEHKIETIGDGHTIFTWM